MCTLRQVDHTRRREGFPPRAISTSSFLRQPLLGRHGPRIRGGRGKRAISLGDASMPTHEMAQLRGHCEMEERLPRLGQRGVRGGAQHTDPANAEQQRGEAGTAREQHGEQHGEQLRSSPFSRVSVSCGQCASLVTGSVFEGLSLAALIHIHNHVSCYSCTIKW